LARPDPSPSGGVKAGLICVAEIGAPHGVRGEVRLFAFTADPMAVGRYGPLQSADGTRMLTIASLRAAKDHLIARLIGIDSREAAEALRRQKLYIPRERLPATEDDEFYYADLIGLAAGTADGSPFGSVIAVHDFGAGDLLEIAPTGGGPTVMLPFTKAAVPEIDIAGGRIVVVPPQDAPEEPEEAE
jgi:16S rRNA processing protein RimM